jgi:hypothetical protein
MAISIPIVTEFDGGGISKAVQQFKQLEGAGAKAQFAIKKAAVPAAAALGGLALALGDSVKGAMEDAAAQEQLARQLFRSAGATDDAIKATEDWISAQGQALGVTDDELRPSLARLVSQTHDVAKAQELASLSMDIAASTGKPLASVVEAVSKAAGGQLNALSKLSPELKGMIKDGIDASEAFYILDDAFGGAAKTAAGTAEGGFKRLSLTLAETKESIGAALLPIVEKALPILQKFADWAQKNPNLFLGIAAAIGAVATAITAVNFAMALNPFTAIAAGVALLGVALVAAYKKFEGFRNVVNSTINFVSDAFETMGNAIISVLNAVIRAFNILPGKNLPTIPHISLGKVGGGAAGGGGGGGLAIPMMAEGGIVTSPTLAMIGEAGPEAVIPLSRLSQTGGGVTINVHGGDPNAVVAALRTYMRQNGSVPIKVGNAY